MCSSLWVYHSCTIDISIFLICIAHRLRLFDQVRFVQHAMAAPAKHAPSASLRGRGEGGRPAQDTEV